MRIITAPEAPPKMSLAERLFPSPITIFLAGSIENGAAKNWQQWMIDSLRLHPRERELVVFNPRRSEWIADPSREVLDEQINWELDNISEVDIVFFYFQGGTKSPISLLELGLMLSGGARCVVVCEPDFWRARNVQVTCNRHGVTSHKTLTAGLEALHRTF